MCVGRGFNAKHVITNAASCSRTILHAAWYNVCVHVDDKAFDVDVHRDCVGMMLTTLVAQRVLDCHDDGMTMPLMNLMTWTCATSSINTPCHP